MRIDVTKLDWQPDPTDHYGATALVLAGDRKLLVRAAFLLYKAQHARTGIIDALKAGDLSGMKASFTLLDEQGEPCVSHAINSGICPRVPLRVREGVQTVNAQLTEAAGTLADPDLVVTGVAAARFRERMAAEMAERVRG